VLVFRIILNNRGPEPSGKKALADVRIIQSLYKSIETGTPEVVRSEARYNRPNAKQEIPKPQFRSLKLYMLRVAALIEAGAEWTMLPIENTA